MHVFVKPLCIGNKNGYIAKLFESIQLHLFSENIHHDFDFCLPLSSSERADNSATAR